VMRSGSDPAICISVVKGRCEYGSLSAGERQREMEISARVSASA